MKNILIALTLVFCANASFANPNDPVLSLIKAMSQLMVQLPQAEYSEDEYQMLFVESIHDQGLQSGLIQPAQQLKSFLKNHQMQEHAAYLHKYLSPVLQRSHFRKVGMMDAESFRGNWRERADKEWHRELHIRERIIQEKQNTPQPTVGAECAKCLKEAAVDAVAAGTIAAGSAILTGNTPIAAGVAGVVAIAATINSKVEECNSFCRRRLP